MKWRTRKAANAKLLPCPFCGGAAGVREDYLSGDGAGFIVSCTHDGAADPDMCPIAPFTWPYVTIAAAIEGWNTRQPIPSGKGKP